MNQTVRTAKSVKSLKELPISKAAMRRCQGMSAQEFILLIRWEYHNVNHTDKRKSWLPEAVQNLDDAGFIRHDFDHRSFGVGALYRFASHIYADSRYVGGVRDLDTNEKYETYRNLSEEELEKVVKALDYHLDELEAKVAKAHFGIEKEPFSADELMERFGLTKTAFRAIEIGIMRKLWRLSKMPVISQFSS